MPTELSTNPYLYLEEAVPPGRRGLVVLHLHPGVPRVGALPVFDRVVALELCLAVDAVAAHLGQGEEDGEGERDGPGHDGHHAQEVDAQAAPRRTLRNGVDDA